MTTKSEAIEQVARLERELARLKEIINKPEESEELVFIRYNLKKLTHGTLYTIEPTYRGYGVVLIPSGGGQISIYETLQLICSKFKLHVAGIQWYEEKLSIDIRR